ncbi:ABC transporter permease [Streptococcus merionis]|uniref:Uncharacterized protein conserved in bacteria n=1 Tax=Streptococcus merionis TaxID=400065 RepID=A0A239SUW7_9STRE|nr:ABC transporter permease [Streptococcus merionis]SNU89126.1 Uncharacterized protein conserved in bacteria [Streptococcus merionis]
MWKTLRIEAKKYRGLPVFRLLSGGILATILVTMVTVFKIKSPEELADPITIHSIMGSMAFMKVIILPVVLASLASMAVQLENRHKMWNVLKSSGVSYASIYRVKLLYIYMCYVLAQLVEWAVLVLVLRQRGFTGFVPLHELLLYGVTTLLISGFILLGHYLLSLRWSNQLVSLSVAMLGSLMGIIIVLISQIVMKVLPYSWYAFLMRVEYVKVGEEFTKQLRAFDPYPLVASFILGILLYQIGKRMKVGD